MTASTPRLTRPARWAKRAPDMNRDAHERRGHDERRAKVRLHVDEENRGGKDDEQRDETGETLYLAAATRQAVGQIKHERELGHFGRLEAERPECDPTARAVHHDADMMLHHGGSAMTDRRTKGSDHLRSFSRSSRMAHIMTRTAISAHEPDA